MASCVRTESYLAAQHHKKKLLKSSDFGLGKQFLLVFVTIYFFAYLISFLIGSINVRNTNPATLMLVGPGSIKLYGPSADYERNTQRNRSFGRALWEGKVFNKIQPGLVAWAIDMRGCLEPDRNDIENNFGLI